MEQLQRRFGNKEPSPTSKQAFPTHYMKAKKSILVHLYILLELVSGWN